MTLLLLLAAPWAIHESSDYRLTSLAPSRIVPPDDEAGAKQLTIRSLDFVAQLSFTGVAQVGSVKTREWISQIIAHAAQPVDIELIASEIASHGTDAVKTLRHDCKMLTVVIGTVERGKKPRISLISNMDRLDGPRRTQPLDRLEVSSLTPTQPMLRAFGHTAALSKNDRRFLVNILRSESDPKLIKEALASVNKRAAQSSEARQLISEGCMVSSLLEDGSTSAINFGQVAGVPDGFMGNFNFGNFVRTHFRAAPGKELTLVQSASASRTGNEGYRELLPEGTPRILNFSSPTSSLFGVANTIGGEFDKLTLHGQDGSVAIRKNEPVRVTLNKVTWEVGQTDAEPSVDRQFRWLKITNLPTVEAVQPRTWDYLFDVTVKEESQTLTIHKNSVAFRSANFDNALPILGATEELVMVAPRDGLTLSTTINDPVKTATIEAEFLLRDFPELGPPTAHSMTLSLPKGAPTRELMPVSSTKRIGRNEPCPCGSGRKYKKCCL